MPSGSTDLKAVSWENACICSSGWIILRSASSECCVLIVWDIGIQSAFLESLSLLRPLTSAYYWTKSVAFASSLAFTLPLYSGEIPMVLDSFIDKERTVDHACLASSDIEILSKCLWQVARLDSFASQVISRFISSHCLQLVLRSLRNVLCLRRSCFSWAFILGSLFCGPPWWWRSLPQPFYDVTEGIQTLKRDRLHHLVLRRSPCSEGL